MGMITIETSTGTVLRTLTDGQGTRYDHYFIQDNSDLTGTAMIGYLQGDTALTLDKDEIFTLANNNKVRYHGSKTK